MSIDGFKKMLSIYTMEYYSVLKRDEVLIHATIWNLNSSEEGPNEP